MSSNYNQPYPQLYRQFSQRSSLFGTYPDRLNCQLCHKILIEPIQTKCGCRFCLMCIGNYASKLETQCPNCTNEDIIHDELVRDKAVEREIMNLKMKCVNKGCEVTVLFKFLGTHLVDCDARNIQCDKCQQWYPVVQSEKHCQEECKKCVIECNDCGEKMTKEYFENQHRNYIDNPENICEMWIRDCPNQCNREKLINMRIHLRSCPNKPSECEFKSIGCQFRGTKEAVELHMAHDKVNHEVMMMTELVNLRHKNEELSIKNSEQDNWKSEVEQLRENCCKVNEAVQELTEKCRQLEASVMTLKQQLSSMEISEPCRDIVVEDGTVTWTIANIREKIISSSDNGQIVSEPFYVTRPGYHMSLKVYLTGDGRARNKYLSLFFVINRGQYDAEVTWPFRSKVSLSIVANGGARRHVTVHMKPDHNAACYDRPLTAANVGAGQPEFIKLTEITDGDHYLHRGALRVTLTIT